MVAEGVRRGSTGRWARDKASSIPALSLDLLFQSLSIRRSLARFCALLLRDLAPHDSRTRAPAEGWRFRWREKRQWRVGEWSLARSFAASRGEALVGETGAQKENDDDETSSASLSLFRPWRLILSNFSSLNTRLQNHPPRKQ